MARKLSLLFVIVLMALPSAAQAFLPPGFIGVSPQGPTKASDYQLMAEANVESLRLPLY